MVRAGLVDLYPSISHKLGLRSLRETLDKRNVKIIPAEELLKMVEFALQNNYSEFANKIKQQISGTAFGAEFSPSYSCIFMKDLETKFLGWTTFRLNLQILGWLHYIDDTFFSFGTMVKRVLKEIQKNLLSSARHFYESDFE